MQPRERAIIAERTKHSRAHRQRKRDQAAADQRRAIASERLSGDEARAIYAQEKALWIARREKREAEARAILAKVSA